MDNRLEIVVTLRNALDKPTQVRFEELYDLRKDLASIMFLWNSNSYYVDSLSKVFMVNGGRRLGFDSMGECEIVYRKRNSQVVSMTGGTSKVSIAWILGIQDISGKMVAIKIADEGSSWEWIDSL